MIDQVKNLKCMLVRNKAWQLEVEQAASPPVPPNESRMNETIVVYEALESLNPAPRIIVKSTSWSTAFNHGACLESSSQQMTIEMVRPLVDPESSTSLGEMYEEVCLSVQNIANELTRVSYGEGNYDETEYLADLLIECGEVFLDDVIENEIPDPEDHNTTQTMIWWCTCQVTPQSR